jgi:MFS family permease
MEGSSTSLRAVVVSVGILATAVLPTFLTASLAVDMRDSFALSDGLLGAVVATSYAVAALFSSAAGRLVDRIGLSSSVWLTACLAAASSLGIAAGVRSAPALFGFLVLAGLANALATPAGTAVIGRELATRRLGLGIGIQHAGVPVGALLAGLALPLVAVPLGWRTTFAIAGMLTLLVPLLGRVEHAPRAERARARVEPSEVRPLVLLAVATGLATGAATGLIAFEVLYAVEVGLSVGAAGVLLAATSLAAASTRIVVGVLIGGRESRAMPWAAAMMAASAVGYAGLAVGEPATVVVGGVLASGVGWGWSALLGLAVARAHPDALGGAVGIWATGIYAGAGGGPLLVGLVAEGHSFRAAWIGAFGCVLAGAAIVVAVAPMLGRTSAKVNSSQ